MPRDDTESRAELSSPGQEVAKETSYQPSTPGNWIGPPTDVAEALDELASTGGGAASSVVFITDATGAGTISNKSYLANTVPADKILTAFESDDDDITVTVEIDVISDDWQPASVTLSGAGATPVVVNKQDWTQVDNSRRFTATANLTDADTTGTITATMSDGDTSTVAYTRAADPPIVSSATWGQYTDPAWSGGEYPTDGETGLQTAVKSGDTVDIQFTLDSDATNIQVLNTGASSSTQTFGGAYSAGVNYIEGVVCGSRSGAQVFTIKANRDGGTYGATTATGNITMDQTAHAFNTIHNQVFDPVGNFALKSGDDCTGDVEITNWSAGNDVIAYASSEVTISAPTAYTEAKTYTYLAGTYTDSGTNVTITSRRKANGKQTTHSYLIKICNAAATLSLTPASTATRWRSKTGGDNSDTITITSNYELKSLTCTRDPADDGDALGAWSGSPPDKTWTNTLTVGEEDTKNVGAAVYTWAGILATTGSGLTTAAIGTNPTYVIGGFEERTLDPAPYATLAAIGTMVTNEDNAANLIATRVGVGSLEYVGNDTVPQAGKYTIADSGGSFDADGDYFLWLDTAAAGVGLDEEFTIEESA